MARYQFHEPEETANVPPEFDGLFRDSPAGQHTTVLPAYPIRPGEPGAPPPIYPDNQQTALAGPPQAADATRYVARQPGDNNPVPGFGEGYGQPPRDWQQQHGQPPRDWQQQPGWQQPDWQQQGPRRPRRNLVLAVAGVVVLAVGVTVGVLVSGGSSGKGGSPSASPTASNGESAQQQLAAVYQLISSSKAMRAQATGAVSDVESCRNEQQAAAALRATAAQRQSLAQRVSALPVTNVQQGSQLTHLLSVGWSQSADSDSAFSQWAGSGVCKSGKLAHDANYRAGAQASGQASVAKAQAAQLWNQVAAPAGEPQITPGEL